MSKLYFRYGTMDSSKTARLLMDAHEYYQRDEFVLLMKPTKDTRSHKGMIQSRIGLSEPCLDVSRDFNVFTYILGVLEKQPIACILVDEAQFLTTQQVVHLRLIADNLNIPVMCYGLKTDFLGNMFEGSKALFEHSNRLEEVKTICREAGCTNKAMYNGRFMNGMPVFNGEQVVVGDTKQGGNNYYYIPKCSIHFFQDFENNNKSKGV